MDALARFERVPCFEITRTSRLHAVWVSDLRIQPLERRLVHNPGRRRDLERMTQLVTEYLDRGRVRHRTRDFDEHVSDDRPRREQHGPACQQRRLELPALNFDDE